MKKPTFQQWLKNQHACGSARAYCRGKSFREAWNGDAAQMCCWRGWLFNMLHVSPRHKCVCGSHLSEASRIAAIAKMWKALPRPLPFLVGKP